jgi:hypothetical protein
MYAQRDSDLQHHVKIKLGKRVKGSWYSQSHEPHDVLVGFSTAQKV